MNEEKIEIYKKRLLEDRVRIDAEIKQGSNPPNFGNDVDGFDEETDEADAFSNQLVLVGDLKTRLIDIDSALEKINSGKYGTCEKCNSPIENFVLEVDPESRLCKNCKAVV